MTRHRDFRVRARRPNTRAAMAIARRYPLNYLLIVSYLSLSPYS